MSLYRTEEIELEVENLKVKLLKVTNVDELFDLLVAKGEDHEDVKDERIPYWAELWPAALGMSHYLVQSGIVQPGLTVTELGCGLALPGIIAGLLGANVTLTDYLEEALLFARRNWSLNLPEEQLQTALLDWREPNPALAADLLIASDITYEKRYFEYLPNAFITMCKPGGRIVVSDPNRHVAGAFFEDLPAKGFILEKHRYEVPSLVTDKLHAVSVYVIWV